MEFFLEEGSVKELINLCKENGVPLSKDDFYLDKRSGKLVPRAQAWDKIRIGAKISIEEENVFTRSIGGLEYLVVTVKGSRQVGKKTLTDISSKAFNLETRLKMIERVAQERAKEKKWSDAFLQKYIESETLRIKSFAFEITESGAKARLVSSLLGLKTFDNELEENFFNSLPEESSTQPPKVSPSVSQKKVQTSSRATSIDEVPIPTIPPTPHLPTKEKRKSKELLFILENKSNPIFATFQDKFQGIENASETKVKAVYSWMKEKLKSESRPEPQEAEKLDFQLPKESSEIQKLKQEILECRKNPLLEEKDKVLIDKYINVLDEAKLKDLLAWLKVKIMRNM